MGRVFIVNFREIYHLNTYILTWLICGITNAVRSWVKYPRNLNLIFSRLSLLAISAKHIRIPQFRPISITISSPIRESSANIHQKQFYHLHIKSQSMFVEASSHSTASAKILNYSHIIHNIRPSSQWCYKPCEYVTRGCPGGDNRKNLFMRNCNSSPLTAACEYVISVSQYVPLKFLP